MQSIFWHDYETWGIDPARDRPAQFAGVRTDLDLNIIDDPVNLLCRPALDTVPEPGACLVTGLTPQRAARQGVPESAFVAAILEQLAAPQTCAAGYNSLRFDDEVTRYLLYRNLRDPYAREWQSGNSRWDIIDLLRTSYALRPEGIEWPVDATGTVSFRLERLTEVNGMEHTDAHDALADVYATIAMAKRVRARQPKLYQHLFALRDKREVTTALRLGSGEAILHISSKIAAAMGCATLVLPVTRHPVNRNEILCVDLRYPPASLIEHDASELAEWLFTPVADIPESIGRIPLKSIHINRCPVVLTPKLLDPQACERLALDPAVCEAHRQQLLACPGLEKKLREIMEYRRFDVTGRDVDQRLYEGFINAGDRRLLDAMLADSNGLREGRIPAFEDERLPELVWRYRARHYPESLSAAEQERWYQHCAALWAERADRIRSELCSLQAASEPESDATTVLQALDDFYRERSEELEKGLATG